MTTIKDVKLPSLLKQSLKEAFPDVDPKHTPLGSLVLIQIKQPATKTASGFILSGYDKEVEADNTSIAKVLQLGIGAFKNRTDLKPWPEGDWVMPGNFIRISKYVGERWTRAVPGTDGHGRENRIEYALIEDLTCKALVHAPLEEQAFF